MNLSSAIPIREGFTFLGWSITEDGTGILLEPGNVSFMTVHRANLGTIYAVWDSNPVMELVFESDPIADGIIIPPGYHLVTITTP